METPPPTPDQLEETATYNLGELNRIRDRGEGDTQLAKLFEHRMNSALEELRPYFQLAGAVVVELTHEPA